MNRRPHTSDTRRGELRPTILLAAVLGVSMSLLAPTAQAQTPTQKPAATENAKCTFYEIQVSNDGKGVDPKLSKLAKKLKRPMFSAWTKFDLLNKHDVNLSLTETNLINIVSGAKLSILYKEYSKGKKERFKLRLTVLRKNGKRALGTDFTVYTGDYLLISMPTKAKGKGYILGATCSK